MKVIKIRLDNVLAGQLTELSASVGLSLVRFCELSVMQKAEELADALQKAREKIQQDAKPEEKV